MNPTDRALAAVLRPATPRPEPSRGAKIAARIIVATTAALAAGLAIWAAAGIAVGIIRTLTGV